MENLLFELVNVKPWCSNLLADARDNGFGKIARDRTLLRALRERNFVLYVFPEELVY
ncbi:MAG: hypothetical protein PHW76_01500 [Alphaproteobacteria bacterium]|nr:hypothetical protein [Alphaproteobacteria bacterium]